MGRPKKWSNDAERMAVRRGRVNEQTDRVNEHEHVRIEQVNEQSPAVNEQAEFVPFRHQPHVPLALFDGAGRGSRRTHTDGRAYVLVARDDEHAVVTAADWGARLGQRCTHGHAGWSCHTC